MVLLQVESNQNDLDEGVNLSLQDHNDESNKVSF
jgi:hypothetical protein